MPNVKKSQWGRMTDLGSIEAGKVADLVVLGQNLFEISRFDVHKIKPAVVVMDRKLKPARNHDQCLGI